MDGELLLPLDVDKFCAEHAEAIRVLGRRIVGDIIEIGQRLIAVRRVKAPQGRWLSWIETEFSWTDRTALNFMRVAEHFKSETVSDLPIDVTALYLLAGPSVPQAARDAAITKAEAGEHITKAEAEVLIADARRTAGAQITNLEREIEELRKAADEGFADALTKAASGQLVARIAALEAQRDELRDSLRKANKALKEKPAASAPELPPVDGTVSFRAMCIRQAVATLHDELKITPDAYVAIEREVAARVHNQSADADLAAICGHARACIAWLNELISGCEVS